jgi:N-acetylglucosamine kinase-like BadF-type ATPase
MSSINQFKRYVLGVDGGGSETRCTVADSEGIIYKIVKGGASNPLTVGIDEALTTIKKLIRLASERANLSHYSSSCFGIAGTERDSIRNLMIKGLSEPKLGKIKVVSDVKSAFTGAIPIGHGVVVVSGTGSIVYSINEAGKEARSGGWGWRVGDEGSGYNIGVECIRSALKAFDGRGQPTLLTTLLEEKLKLNSFENIIDWVYNSNRRPSDIASLSKLVGSASSKGDESSLTILSQAGSKLAQAAVSVIKKLSLRGEFPLVLSGGSFNLGGTLISSLKYDVKKIAPQCQVKPPRFPPVVGSAILALRNIELEIGSLILDNIERYIKGMGDK